MDTLTRVEIETALSTRLPNCEVNCVINPDGSLSVTILAHGNDQFTIANINRADYPGEPGVNRLIREILQEMVFSSRSSRRSSMG